MHDRPLEAIFRPALILMTGRALGFCVAFAIPIILVRFFSQEDFGTYKQLFLIYGTLFAIAQVGMAESLFYFLPNERKHGGGYVFNTLAVLGVIGLLCFAGMWLLQGYIAKLLNNPDLVNYLPYLGVYLLFMLMSVLLEIVMTVRKQHGAASTIYALSDLFRAVFYIVPVLLFADLHWLMLGAVGFSLVRFATALLYVRREFAATLRPDKPLLRKHLRYAVPFGFAGLIEVLQTNFHMYAVSYHFDVATFAIYAVGCLQVPLSEFLTSSTSNVMMTNMREKLLEGNKPEAWLIWLDTTRKISLVMFPLVAGLLLLAHEIITLLFGAAYERSVPVFMVWTLGTLTTVLLADGVLRVLAETRFLIILNVIQLVLIALTIQWFIVRLDLIGAVLVSLMTTVIYQVLAMLRIKVVMGISTPALLPWGDLTSCALVTVAALLPALLLKTWWELPDLLTIMASGGVFCLSYTALLLLWGPMAADEKQMLLQWMRTPVVWVLRAREG